MKEIGEKIFGKAKKTYFLWTQEVGVTPCPQTLATKVGVEWGVSRFNSR